MFLSRVNRIFFLSIVSVIRSKIRKKNAREREVRQSVRERSEYHSPRRKKMLFFSRRRCFCASLAASSSCFLLVLQRRRSRTKKMTISLAGVTGETSRRPINSYFISRFSGKSHVDLSVYVSFIFREKENTTHIRYIIFTCKTDKTLTVHQNYYNHHLHHESNHSFGIIQHLSSSSPSPHLKCMVRASCISHMNSTRD